MLTKRLRVILLSVLLLLLLFWATASLLSALAQRPNVQRYVLGQLSKATGYELSTGRVDVSFWGGIGISAYDLEARSPTGAERIVALRARIILDTFALIRGRIVPTGVVLSSPRIELALEDVWTPPEPGQPSFFKASFFKRMAGLRSVSVVDGRVDITNSSFKLQNLFIDISQIHQDPIKLAISLNGNILSQSDSVPFSLRGIAYGKASTKEAPSSEMKLKLSQLPLTWIRWPGIMDVMEGLAEADIGLKGSLDGRVWATGNVVVQDFSFSLVYPEISKNFQYSHLDLDFASFYQNKRLQISSVNAKNQDLSLTASLDLDLKDSADPHLSLQIDAPFMPLETFKETFPSPLFSGWIEYELFPILTGGEIRLNLFSLNGTLKQIGNLSLPENNNRLLMKTDLKDLVVYEKEDFLPFKAVTGKLSIENGELSLSGIKADFGQSTIRDATIHIDNLFGDAYIYDVSLDGLCDLEDLLLQKEMPLLPGGLRRQLHEFDSASGELEGCIQFYHEQGGDYPRIRQCQFGFRDCLIRHRALHLPLSLDEAGFEINGEGQSQFWGTGEWGRSQFQGSGTAESSWQTTDAYIVGRADLNEILGYYYQGQQLPMQFSDLAGCRLSLSGREDRWSCRGELSLDNVVMETDSLFMDPKGKEDKITFSVDYYPGEENYVRNLRCSLGDSLLDLSGFYSLGNRDSYNLKVSTEGVSLEDLGIRFKKSGRTAKGMLSGRVEIDGSTGDSSITAVTGKLAGKGLSFDLRTLPSPVNDCDFALEFLGKEGAVHFLKTRVGQSPIQVQGHLWGWDQLKGTLTVNASFLDDSDILFDEPSASPESPETDRHWLASHTDLKIRLNVDHGLWRAMKYGALEADCAFRSGDFYIEQSKVQMEHGILEVRGHIKGGKRPENLFSIYVKVRDQPAQEFLNALGVQENYIEGRLAMEAVLFSRGKDTKRMISGLTGSANVQVDQGKINKSNVLVKVMDFLSLQNIFAKRPPDLLKEGLYFERLNGHITINKGVLETNDFMMKSPVFNAAAKGSLDLNRKWVELEMGTQPLGTIDSVVSRLPSVGYILSGEKETVLIYYFDIKGPLSNPDVQYIPLKNLERSVIGFFKRLFLTTGSLFQEMSDITKESLKKGVPLPEGNR